MTDTTAHRRLHTKPKIILLAVLACLGVFLGLLSILGVSSWQARHRYSAVEMTFISPQQGVLFWKTEEPGVGYVQLGASRHQRSQQLLQTSSDPSEVHAVMLEGIPPEGVYVSIHTQGDSKFILPKIYHIRYEEGSDGGPL